MNLYDTTLAPLDIAARYEQAIATCPLLMAQRIPPATEDTVQVLRQALAIARDSREWKPVARLANTLGLIYFERLNLHDARLYIQEAILMFRLLDDIPNLAQTLGNLATVEY